MAGKYKYLALEDRRKIEQWRREDKSPAEIAKALGIHRATINRELLRGRTEDYDEYFNPGYSATVAQRSIKEAFARRGCHAKRGSA
jgi:IS30 family transposase